MNIGDSYMIVAFVDLFLDLISPGSLFTINKFIHHLFPRLKQEEKHQIKIHLPHKCLLLATTIVMVIIQGIQEKIIVNARGVLL